MTRTPPSRLHRERGMVLMVVLVMLLVITLLAVMAIGTATTEQKIVATAHFHNMGFQAGESAIEAAMVDVPHLSAALASTAPVSRSAINLGNNQISAVAQTTYLTNAPVLNNSINGFAAYHFLIQGTGTVGASGVNLSAVTAQGVFRLAPAALTNN